MSRAALIVPLAVLLAGCGTQSERVNAREQTNVDRSAPEVYAMPNFYNNVASKCDGHGHRIFVTSNKEASPSNIFVIDDGSCGR
jgi:hypothetical protein